MMRVRLVLLDEGYAVATVNMALSALKSVAGAAFSMGILDADRLTRIRSVRRHWQPPAWAGRWTGPKFRAMLAAAGKADAVRCQRNRAILLLLCGAGLRAAELVAPDVGDIDVATGIVIVRQGKGRKIREIHLSGKVCMQLRRWLKLRGIMPGRCSVASVVRGSQDDNGLPPRVLQGCWRSYAKLQKWITSPPRPATDIHHPPAGAGVDINVVRQLAGHADISTTTSL